MAGENHTCAILNSNVLKCWGRNARGQLGRGDVRDQGGRANEMGNSLGGAGLGIGIFAKKVAAGSRHTCAILSNDEVKCWGENSSGQLGLGDTNHRGDVGGEMASALPAIDWGTGLVAQHITGGDAGTCGLLNDNTVKCWGFNSTGQLGQGNTANWGDSSEERAGNGLSPINLGSEFASFQLSSASGTGGRYGLGRAVGVTVTFSEPVSISHNGDSRYPRLTLGIGESTSYASYGGSGVLSATHTFTYTVGVGENDEDGIQVTAVELQGGFIRNAAGAGAIFPTPLELDVSGVLVDTVSMAITGLSDTAVPTQAQSWSWDCVDSSTPCEYRFVVNTVASAHAFVDTDTWGTTNTATVSSGTGTYYLHVQGRDGAGNVLAVQSYSAILDNTAPQVVGDLEVPASATYRLGASLDFAVSYDEDVVVAGTPFLSLSIGSDSRNAEYVASESTLRKLVFRYRVQSAESDSDGVAWDGTIQSGQGGSIGDRAGNAVTLTGLTVPSLTGVVVDGAPIATFRGSGNGEMV